MEQPTHYLTLTLGLDYTQIFKPEHIQGIKYLLGAQSDEDVINILANNIAVDVGKALESSQDFATIVDASINPAHTMEAEEEFSEEDEVDDSPEESELIDEPTGLVKPEPEPETTPWTENHEDNEQEEDYEVDLKEEADGALIYDSYGRELIEAISQDTFAIESHLGYDIVVYVQEYDKYILTMLNEFGSQFTIAPFDGLGSQADELQSEDYVIEYKDMNGEVKYGKRNLNKENNEDEEENN